MPIILRLFQTKLGLSLVLQVVDQGPTFFYDSYHSVHSVSDYKYRE